MVIDDKRLVEIAARVQAPELDPVSKARMRAALLSTIEGVSPKPAAEAASPWNRRVGFTMAAACVLLGGLWALRSEQSERTSAGEVDRVLQASSLVLVDGVARYEEVVALDSTGPVRLLAGDAVVLSSGASFEVSVEEARLQQIVVLAGHLDVILVDHGRITIQAGQTLRASAMSRSVEIFSSVIAPEPSVGVPEPSASAPEPSVGVPEPSVSAPKPLPRSLAQGADRRRANRKSSAELGATVAVVPPPIAEPADESPSSVSEDHFGLGFRAYKNGNFKEAIKLLSVVLSDSPSAALSRDARYWTALALVGDGRKEAAVAAMEQFVSIHPNSGRAGEVHGRLGWLLLELGRERAARSSFGRATQDSRLRVRENAETGLQRLSQ